MVMLSSPTTRNARSSGGRLVARDGRELPLQSVHLAVEAGGGIARTVLTQVFENPFDEPLEVRYLLPLPADGAVSGFAFVLGEQRIVGEVTGKQQARERFQRAIASGRTAALLEQDRSSLFSQRVGNIPPRTAVSAEVIVDQPLRWLEEGAWEWRFPTVVTPRYQGVVGRVKDALKLSVPVAPGQVEARATLDLGLSDRLTGQVESPSHGLDVTQAAERTRIELAKGAKLDRDLVVTWPVALPDVSASVLAARPATAAHDGDTFALVTIAPPASGGQALPRDLTVLIDTSGSMSGRPLTQAKRVVEALVQSLGIEDRLELIEFSNSPVSWKREPTIASETNKQDALRWVRNLRAGGCTEMHRALIAALKPLRTDSQRQVVLITDGAIGFEEEIVRALLEDLPGQARVHTVGVGSGVNRSLTQAAARAGRGAELILGVEENPDKLVYRLLAKTRQPLVTELRLEGASVVGCAPRGLPDLYAESPALIAVRARAGASEVVLRGKTADGMFVQTLQLPEVERGAGPAGVVALFARETVEDLETSLSAGGDRRELNGAIEATGVRFQIATRLTSWIAVSQKQTVDPTARARQVEQPHALPHGTSAEGLGLRSPAKPATGVFKRSMLSFEETKNALGVDEDELKRLVSSADLRGFRDKESMVFKADDVDDLLQGRETEPTILFGNADQDMGIAESSDELILDDSTSDTVIHIGDIMGGARVQPIQQQSAEEVFDGPVDYDAALEPPSETFPPRFSSSSSSFRAPSGSAFGAGGFVDGGDMALGGGGGLDEGEEATEAFEVMGAADGDDDYDPFMAMPSSKAGSADQLTRDGAWLGSLEPSKDAKQRRSAGYQPRSAKSKKVNLLLVLVALAILAIVIASALGLWGVGPQ